MSALGSHLSVISQSLSQESDCTFQARFQDLSTPIPLPSNTGIPSECTETNLMIHRSTEVTTEFPFFISNRFTKLDCESKKLNLI